MTVFSIEIVKQAEADLRGIYEYIAFELMSPQTAEGQLKRLENGIYGLEQMPERFRAYTKEPWRKRGLRVMPVDNYLVFYIPDADKQTVKIIRVMYGGRDIDTQLAKFT